MIKALTAFFLAATAYLNRWHLWKLADLDKDISKTTDEIDNLSGDPSPANFMRIERLAQQLERQRTLRAAFDNTTKGK